MGDDHWLFVISANKCLYITCQKSWVWTMFQWFAEDTDRRMWNYIYFWDFLSSSTMSVSLHTLRSHRRKAFGTIWAPLLQERDDLSRSLCTPCEQTYEGHLKSSEEACVYSFLLNGAKQLRTCMASNCRHTFRDFAIPVLAQLSPSVCPEIATLGDGFSMYAGMR